MITNQTIVTLYCVKVAVTILITATHADLYDSANFEAKKMIVNQLIRRVDVYRGYQINISFNFDLTPYIEGE